MAVIVAIVTGSGSSCVPVVPGASRRSVVGEIVMPVVFTSWSTTFTIKVTEAPLSVAIAVIVAVPGLRPKIVPLTSELLTLLVYTSAISGSLLTQFISCFEVPVGNTCAITFAVCPV